MAKLLYAVLFVAALAIACCAAERELNAHISTGTAQNIANCANVGGPSKISLNVFIENSLGQFMGVNYEYFNNNTGQWVSAGKLCNVVATENCQVRDMPITLGGKGNGTFTGDMLRLTGTSEAAPGDTYTKTFQLTITHYTGEREASLTTQMRAQTADLASTRSACASNSRCCPQASRDAIDSADSMLSGALAAVSACDFETMYSDITAAESLLDSTTSAINICLASATPTPGPNATPSETPSIIETPTPAPQHTQTPPPATPVPTPTPAPKGGMCPTGAALLLGLGFAALAARK